MAITVERRKVTAEVKIKHADPVEGLREAVALLAAEDMKPSHISIHAPWHEEQPWTVLVTGERPFKEVGVSAGRLTAFPTDAGAAPPTSETLAT